MLITSKVPLRVSFIGGGTDYESFFSKSKSPGFVFGMTIDKFVYTSVFIKEYEYGHKIKLDYKERELIDSIRDIKHPIIREVLNLYSKHDRLEISTHADVPAGTGLGSSSSFCVSLIAAIMYKKDLDLSRNELADMAVKIERKILKENGGVQDQYFAAFGGCLGIEFKRENTSIINMKDTSDRFEEIKSLLDNCFLLVPIGQPRPSQIIAMRTEARTATRLSDFEEYAMQARNMFQKFLDATSDGDRLEVLKNAIRLSNQFKSADLKKSSQSLSTRHQQLSDMGAIATKLCGAGESGFILALVEPSRRDEVQTRVNIGATQKAFPLKLHDTGIQVSHY